MENFFSLSIRNIFFEFSRNEFIMVLLIEMRYYKKKKKNWIIYFETHHVNSKRNLSIN